ncbi:MAG TPA: methionyl-tRNA formyltransferase [Stellaceae bacterium]|jgi:methionyl-tRNA formyltransferase|nr:methionyl-tRNA formyltransferase [Stellaceae bacterium]
MRIAIVGQQAFGKAALDAFLEHGDDVAGVFVAPEPAGARPDPLREAAQAKGLKCLQLKSLGSPEALSALKELDVELGVMAYVTQFAPQAFVTIPKHGMIQFHPSLLPLHRGPSSINWAIIQGRTKTGLTIFRPTDGLDEGAVILQKEVDIGPDDTLGSVYFDRIFPTGVKALLEAADAVVAGKAREVVQDESIATYEGWCRSAESQISWANHADKIYDLIRGCNPAPGAWCKWGEKKLYLFESKKIPVHVFATVKGFRPGQVMKVEGGSFTVCAHGGLIEVQRCRIDDGKKIAGNEAGIEAGTILG